MTTDTTTEAPKRKRRDPPPGFVIQPIAVDYETAGAMLGRLSERTVERLVTEGRLKAKRLTDGRNGIAVAELERYLREAPDVLPGVGE